MMKLTASPCCMGTALPPTDFCCNEYKNVVDHFFLSSKVRNMEFYSRSHNIKILDQFQMKTTPSGPSIKFAGATLAPA